MCGWRTPGRVLTRRSSAKGVPVAYANPKEGRNSWVGVYGIRKGTPNLELALKFLDDKLANATVDERRESVLLRLFEPGSDERDHRCDAQAGLLGR